MEIIRNYIATLDSKKRLTLRKTDIKYYEVKEYDNGCIVLEPRKLEPISSVSLETLQICWIILLLIIREGSFRKRST